MEREGHCKQIPLACVGSAYIGWTTLGLPQLKVACTSWVHTAQAPGCSMKALSQVSPAFRAHSRPKLHRFLGVPWGHRPRLAVCFEPFTGPSHWGNWVLGEWTVPGGLCILFTSPVPASWFLRCTTRAHPRCAVCLLWGADLRLWHSWQISTLQDPRMWLAAWSLLTVWCKVQSLGPRLQQPLDFWLWLLHACLSASRERGTYMAAGLLSFGIHSILCFVSGPGVTIRC